MMRWEMGDVNWIGMAGDDVTHNRGGKRTEVKESGVDWSGFDRQKWRGIERKRKKRERGEAPVNVYSL